MENRVSDSILEIVANLEDDDEGDGSIYFDKENNLAEEVSLAGLAADLLSTRAQLAALQDKVRWVSITERKPRAKQSVLAIVNSDGKRHIEKACYIPAKTILAEDYLSDDCDCESAMEYDEENDCYWVTEGWWEASWDAETNWKMSGDVTHWKTLLESPIPAEGE